MFGRLFCTLFTPIFVQNFVEKIAVKIFVVNKFKRNPGLIPALAGPTQL